jgi:predicted regulator of Ras-like GTPase activity (Roadblock/LC7/MglB family)
MQTVLSHLNALPEVVGSLVCTAEGQVAAQAFPPLFDPAALQTMVRTLADGTAALDLSSETAELLDLRFKEGRLLAKPFSGSMLVVLCTKAINVQFLILSVTAAVAQLEKLRRAAAQAAPARTPAAPPVLSSTSAPADARETKRVAAPTKGLDELRRRLTEAAALAPTPAGGDPQDERGDARTPPAGQR